MGDTWQMGDAWQIVDSSWRAGEITDPIDAEEESWHTLLQRESGDVYEALPLEFLADYESFCWRGAEEDLLCLPSVYLAGMPKCGSTDLFNKLVWHSQLARPSRGKENHYWARSRLGRSTFHLDSGDTSREPFRAFLRSLGPARLAKHPELRLVDGTQSMLWDQGGWEGRYPGREVPPYSNAQLLQSVTPRAKVLVVTRDPVERLYSDYLYFLQGRNVSAEHFHSVVQKEIARFTSCLHYRSLTSCCYDSSNNPALRLNLGVYVCYLREWLRVFPDQVKVVALEDYSAHQVTTLLRIFSFLELDSPDIVKLSQFLNSSKTSNTRTDSAQKKGDMLPETRQILQDFYSPYNSQLAALLRDTRFLYNYDSD